MSCVASYQSFMDYTVSYRCASNGVTYTYTILQYAKWVSYQSYTRNNAYAGIPVSVIVTQWGVENGDNNGEWSGANFARDLNPGMQGNACGHVTKGTNSRGLPAFADVREAVRAYTDLIISGYPHVAGAAVHAGYGQAGMQAAATALGRGWETGYQYTASYCTANNEIYTIGDPNVNSSWRHRCWACAPSYCGAYNKHSCDGYTSSSNPGASIYGRINNNTCLSQYNSVQTSDPGVYMC